MTSPLPQPGPPPRQLLLDETDLRRSPLRTALTAAGIVLALGCGGFVTWFVASFAVGALSPAQARSPTAPPTAPPVTAAPPAVASRSVPKSHTPLRTLPAPRPRRAGPPKGPAVLDVNSIPWGIVSLDGQDLGNTPILRVEISPGVHHVMVRREGFEPVMRMIEVSPGQHVRIIDLTLRPGQ
jgi:PEGA domain-containing protein